MIELKKTPKNLKNSIAIAAALGLALVLGGCKHKVDDATLNNSVQSKLSADPALTGQPIQVTTANGVVTLSGTVGSDVVRTAAASDVMQVPGIKMLNNSLVVDANAQPPAVAAAPEPTPAPVPAPASAAPSKKSKPSAAAPVVNSGPYQQAPAPIVQNAPPPPPPIPQAPPKPVLKTYTLPVGSVLPIRTTEALSSGTSTQGGAFHGVLAADVSDADGNLILPSGAPVTGQVVTVQDAAHFKGSSLLTITLTAVSLKGERVSVSTEPYSLQGKGRGKNTAEKVGGGAVVGAVLGGIFGGGKGAAIGAAAGAGVGAGANAVTKGQEVSIPSESIVRFKLTNSVSITR